MSADKEMSDKVARSKWNGDWPVYSTEDDVLFENLYDLRCYVEMSDVILEELGVVHCRPAKNAELDRALTGTDDSVWITTANMEVDLDDHALIDYVYGE